ncbi:MAG: lysophospholipid acyltransferase family protein, partial [Bdellovibrionales bacterium]|nr:lysophospholipid acyltransferase family protein [Bdellovibrionales bacterium]
MKDRIISQLAYLFVRLMNFTYRYEFVGLENKEAARRFHPKGAFVFALWHQNLIPGILAHSDETYTMIVSESKDGELVAVTCEKFGHKPARGSSTRGGKKALLEMVRNVKNGIPGALTVDGPKGPPHVVKPGIVELARLAKCAIVPMSPYPRDFWVIKKSWDQFRIPRPFTKIVIALGEPTFINDETTK